FRNAVAESRVDDVVIKQDQITGTFRDKFLDGKAENFITYPPPEDPALIGELRDAKIKFDGAQKEKESWYLVLLANWFPMLLFIGIWIFFMRQIQVGGGKALSFGKSRAKLLEEGSTKITFDDVAGIDESKDELGAVVQFLKNP